MKFFSHLSLVALFILSSFGLSSQNADALKTFINKNDIAVRAVQKNIITTSNAKNTESFKELLKLQLIAVKPYRSDNGLSFNTAYKVREQSVDFLQKNTNRSVEYFKLTGEEMKSYNSQKLSELPTNYLTQNELNLIDGIDVKNPSLFNSFITTIK